jgi:hypothetical protein
MENEQPSECFYCGSKEFYKSGFHKGKQKYLCKTCKRSFVYPRSEREPKPLKPKLSHAEYVREWRAKRKGLPYEPKPRFKPVVFEKRPLPSVDNLIGIPCFCCSELNRGCNPEFCELLTKYLTEIDRKTPIIEVKAYA